MLIKVIESVECRRADIQPWIFVVRSECWWRLWMFGEE